MKNTENQKQRIDFLINLLPDKTFAKAKVARLAGINQSSVLNLYDFEKPLKDSEMVKIEEAIKLMQ